MKLSEKLSVIRYPDKNYPDNAQAWLGAFTDCRYNVGKVSAYDANSLTTVGMENRYFNDSCYTTLS